MLTSPRNYADSDKPTILDVIYQIRRIGYIAPIYYFRHYVQYPLENYAAADNLIVKMRAAKTIIPLIVISFVLPSFITFFAPGLATRQWVNGVVWQPFPIYAFILRCVLGKFVVETTNLDKMSKPEADTPYLRAAYGFAATAATCAYLYVRVTSLISFMDLRTQRQHGH